MKNLSNIILEKLRLNDKIISPDRNILNKLVKAIKIVLGDGVTVSKFDRKTKGYKETIYELNPESFSNTISFRGGRQRIGSVKELNKLIHYCEKVDDLDVVFNDRKETNYFYDTNKTTKFSSTVIGNNVYWIKILWAPFNNEEFREVLISKDLFESGKFNVDNSNNEKRHQNRLNGGIY